MGSCCRTHAPRQIIDYVRWSVPKGACRGFRIPMISNIRIPLFWVVPNDYLWHTWGEAAYGGKFMRRRRSWKWESECGFTTRILKIYLGLLLNSPALKPIPFHPAPFSTIAIIVFPVGG